MYVVPPRYRLKQVSWLGGDVNHGVNLTSLQLVERISVRQLHRIYFDFQIVEYCRCGHKIFALTGAEIDLFA